MVAVVLDTPGLYQLSYKGGSAQFAVNIAPDEPALSAMDTGMLVSSVQAAPETLTAQAPGAVSVIAKSTARERVENTQKIWFYLICVVLAALTAEMIIATRAGAA